MKRFNLWSCLFGVRVDSRDELAINSKFLSFLICVLLTVGPKLLQLCLFKIACEQLLNDSNWSLVQNK